MASSLPLRSALKHGALITAANWPVVVVELTIESLYKFALAVPVIGGAFMVAILLGDDLRFIFGQGVRAAADLIVGSLASAPSALQGFFIALGLVAIGGSIAMYVVKAGTLGVIVASDRIADDIHVGAIHLSTLRHAYTYDLATLLAQIQRFASRSTILALGLSASYIVIGGGYFWALALALDLAGRTSWAPAWPLLVLLATSTSVILVTAINLGFDLLRVIVVTDDCRLRIAFGRLRAFLLADSRQVLGIFGVIGLLVTLAMAVSIVTTAGLTFVAWVPFASLIVLPLQVAAWLVRGLVFQYVGMTALAAYQTQYRRFTAADSRPLTTPLWAQRA